MIILTFEYAGWLTLSHFYFQHWRRQTDELTDCAVRSYEDFGSAELLWVCDEFFTETSAAPPPAPRSESTVGLSGQGKWRLCCSGSKVWSGCVAELQLHHSNWWRWTESVCLSVGGGGGSRAGISPTNAKSRWLTAGKKSARFQSGRSSRGRPAWAGLCWKSLQGGGAEWGGGWPFSGNWTN